MVSTLILGADFVAASLSTCLMMFVLIFTGVANANNMQALQALHEPKESNVELSAWVGQQRQDDDSKIVPKFSVNEQVILYIEVATPRWFTGGTHISNVEIPDVIAKQRNQFATNYTERKGGQTWSRQRWEITLYPQRSGQFVIPSVAVDVQVSASDGSKISSTLFTPPITFETSVPSSLLSDKRSLIHI